VATQGKECVLGLPVSESLRHRRGPSGRQADEFRLVRRLALLLLSVVPLLLAPGGASGDPGVPGDPTPPEITLTTYGTPGANGWYVSNVNVIWTVSEPQGPPLSTSGCDAWNRTADTVGITLTCSATSDGGTTIKSKTIRLDKTPPTVTAAPARAPDANGWYNHPLTVAFSGSDTTSGIGACSQTTYSGPDSGNASVGGSCSDLAGNQSAASAVFKYDATAPLITMFAIKARKRSAELHWRSSPDTRSVELVRSPGKKGAAQTLVFAGAATSRLDTGLRPGRTYHYQLTGTDEAGNKVTRALDFLARGALLNPGPGERVSRPPLLIWSPVKGASYYNVVLVRARRVYSAWPVRSRLQLPRAWVYHGRHHRLRPGLYRWFVWPGFGRLSAGRYGRMVGGSSFVVSR